MGRAGQPGKGRAGVGEQRLLGKNPLGKTRVEAAEQDEDVEADERAEPPQRLAQAFAADRATVEASQRDEDTEAAPSRDRKSGPVGAAAKRPRGEEQQGAHVDQHDCLQRTEGTLRTMRPGRETTVVADFWPGAHDGDFCSCR